jgi:hypothetical protein
MAVTAAQRDSTFIKKEWGSMVGKTVAAFDRSGDGALRVGASLW